MKAMLLNYSVICHDGHQIHNGWKSFGTVCKKIHKIVKLVRNHPERAQPWQMGNLSSYIAVDTILKYLHFGD